MNKPLMTLSILSLLAFSGHSQAAECSIDLGSNDAMQYDKKEITLSKQCAEFTINLKHTGKMAANVMGHNVVISKTADLNAVANDGMAAGEAAGYVKAKDERVIAHSKMIGGGESTSVSFKTEGLAKDGDYSFFCTFPGHFAIMQGKLVITD